MLVVDAWPCSGILHSCVAGRSDRPKQATVPRTGWSWNSSKRAAKPAFMSGTLCTIDLMSKALSAPTAEVASVCAVLGVSHLSGLREAEAGRMLCVCSCGTVPCPPETGVGRSRPVKQAWLIAQRESQAHSDCTGASVMKRIAASMVGGMISTTVLTLLVIPAIYSLWKERHVPGREAMGAGAVFPPRMRGAEVPGAAAWLTTARMTVAFGHRCTVH
jgi:hypothetical protein